MYKCKKISSNDKGKSVLDLILQALLDATIALTDSWKEIEGSVLIFYNVRLSLLTVVRTFVGFAWSFGFFIPATTANDLQLRRIFYPRFYP